MADGRGVLPRGNTREDGLPARYVIGEYEIEPAIRRLRRSSRDEIHLPKRPFDVLLYLVAHRGRLVTRDELLARFWEGRDVYDEALTRCLSSVRKALDDRGEPARFIETRWAEGYRFIGPCEEHDSPRARVPGARSSPMRASASELEEALSLMGVIYDAALDPERWPDALREIAAFVGGVAAALTSQDVAAQCGRFHYSWGDDPRYTALYFQEYVRLNPVLVPLMLLDAGEVRSVSTLLPTEKFRTTRFYKEWAGPAGYGDNTAAVIEKSPTGVTYLGVSHRDAESPVGGAPRRRLELLVPHIRRAVAIGNLIERHRIEADSLAQAVDAIAAGVFLIREDGQLVHANASGRAMLKAGTMLRLEGGSLTAHNTPEGQNLATTVAGASAGELVVPSQGVVIPLTAADGDRYVAHVLPLAFGQRGGPRAGATVAVFVHKAGLRGLLPLEAIARQYSLSAGELRVLVAMIEVGGRVVDIAPVLGLAEPTVKTHLRSLFAKTGAKRQPDLIRLVAGYVNPLLRQP